MRVSPFACMCVRAGVCMLAPKNAVINNEEEEEKEGYC